MYEIRYFGGFHLIGIFVIHHIERDQLLVKVICIIIMKELERKNKENKKNYDYQNFVKSLFYVRYAHIRHHFKANK